MFSFCLLFKMMVRHGVGSLALATAVLLLLLPLLHASLPVESKLKVPMYKMSCA